MKSYNQIIRDIEENKKEIKKAESDLEYNKIWMEAVTYSKTTIYKKNKENKRNENIINYCKSKIEELEMLLEKAN